MSFFTAEAQGTQRQRREKDNLCATPVFSAPLR
jgi:hypothetical protein